MAWLDTTISTLALLFYSLQWTLYKALTVLVYTLRLIAWPITVLGRLLLFGLAPVIHTVRSVGPPFPYPFTVLRKGMYGRLLTSRHIQASSSRRSSSFSAIPLDLR